jgi:hypothetical protein
MADRRDNLGFSAKQILSQPQVGVYHFQVTSLGDTAVLSTLFGGPTMAIAQAVPEPTTLSLAVILLVGVTIRQRRRT